MLSVNLVLGNYGYTTTAAQSYLEELKERLRSLPGITSVGLSSMPPLGHGRISTVGTDIGGHPVEIYPFQVDSDFFKAMSIPILKGRNVFPGEVNAVIVSDSLAQRQWPGENPIGKQFWDKDTVVGVAGDARMIAPNDDDAAETYQAAQPADMPNMVVVVKTAGASSSFVPMIKSAVEALDPKLFPEVRVLKTAYSQGMNAAERIATMVSLMGVAAVLLAGMGIVGLVAYSVSQKTKEIAIRLALGARPLHVFSVVLRQFVLPVFLGMIAGTAGAVAFSRLLRKVLFGLSNFDPAGYAVGISVLIAIALAAMLLPARRALQVDPARALHEE